MGLVSEVLGNVWSHPANEGRRMRAVARVLGWQFYKRTVGGYWNIRVPGGLVMRCYPDSLSGSRMLYANSHPDWYEMWFVRHYLRPGDGFLDIGANIGVYTLLAAPILGPSGWIMAFEPGIKTLERLRENIQLNGLGGVVVHAAAVGEKAGTVRFTQSHDTTNRIETGAGDVGSRDVPVVRLDEVTSGRPWSLAKVDVEGAEPLVLQGAEGMLADRNPPVWLLELSSGMADYGWTRESFRDWLADRGFDMYLYDPEKRILRTEDPPWGNHGNVLAIARDRVGMVKERVGRK